MGRQAEAETEKPNGYAGDVVTIAGIPVSNRPVVTREEFERRIDEWRNQPLRPAPPIPVSPEMFEIAMRLLRE